MMNYFAQAVGIIAMAIAILSFQQKTQKRIITMQFCSSVLFAVHYWLLGAPMGFLLNIVAVIRAFVFARRQKAWAAHPVWVPVFILASLGTYILAFTLFGKAPTARNLIVEFLPVIGMAATTFSFRMKEAAKVRAFSLISSPMWLTYNIVNFSLGGILTESFALCSILIGILRLDRKKPTGKSS